MPKFANERLKKILNLAQDFYGRYGFDDIFTLQVIPVMLCLSMREKLIEIIRINADEVTNILSLIGEPDE